MIVCSKEISILQLEEMHAWNKLDIVVVVVVVVVILDTRYIHNILGSLQVQQIDTLGHLSCTSPACTGGDLCCCFKGKGKGKGKSIAVCETSPHHT